MCTPTTARPPCRLLPTDRQPFHFSPPQFVPSAVFGDDTQVDVVVATPAEGDVTAVLVHAAPLGGRLSSGLLGAALSVRASEPR